MPAENTEQKAQNGQQTLKYPKDKVTEYLSFEIQEKIAENPLRIRGTALTAGISRNLNMYIPEELAAFASKLVNAPMYIEHVAVPFAVGKVTQTRWDGQRLLYEAEIYDEETAQKIRKGLIKHVSIGADYETVDLLNGKIPHGLHNAELSLVAVPGIPDANIQIMENLHLQNAPDPTASGEYILGFQQDIAAFLPEYFSTKWLDQDGGILAVMGKPRSQQESVRSAMILFAKKKQWDQVKIQNWLRLHPDYIPSTPTHLNSANPNTVESLLKKPSEPVILLSEAIQLIEQVLPSPLVQYSWSLGPQRMCQDLRKTLLILRDKQIQNKNQSHIVTESS